MQARGGHRFMACALFAAASIALAAPPAFAGQRHAPRHSFGRGTSTNWSGYAVAGSGATQVIGTWTEPAVTCAPGENSWSSPWVGIDGDTSNTVEQIGTDSDCRNGQPFYYAWYEMYPKSLVTISIPVAPGQSFTGEVTYQGSGNYLLKLTNNSTKTPTAFSTTQFSRKAQRSSIEWIMEGPSNGTLSDFGSVSFSAANGSIGGATANVDQFGNADPITMVTNQGITRAAPLTASGGAFAVNWEHA
jgi:Peptidase A4 family